MGGLRDTVPAMAEGRDIYNRRAISESRGRTQQRILDMQHEPGQIPGLENDLESPVAGSIGAVLRSLIDGWISDKPFTTRRTYERSIMFLVRDLSENGPALSAPAAELTESRLLQHLSWRFSAGMGDSMELARAAVHCHRIAGWSDHEFGTSHNADRDALRNRASELAPQTHS